MKIKKEKITKLTIKNVEEKANKLYEDNYDLSEVKFNVNTDLIIVRCKKHDIKYKISVKNFLDHRYTVCPSCKDDTEEYRLTQDEKDNIVQLDSEGLSNIDIAKELNLTRYSVSYWRDKLGLKKIKPNSNYTQKEYIEEARKIHGDVFDYSELDYKPGNKTIIPITCKVCKTRKQIKSLNHLQAKIKGCLVCASKGKSINIEIIE